MLSKESQSSFVGEESSEAIEMAMKDHEEFEALRKQATEEIGSYINKKIKLKRELKKMKGCFTEPKHP